MADVGAAASLSESFKAFKRTVLKPLFEARGFSANASNSAFARTNGRVRQEISVHAHGNRANDPCRAFTFVAALEAGPASAIARSGAVIHGRDLWYYLDVGNFDELADFLRLELSSWLIALCDRCAAEDASGEPAVSDLAALLRKETYRPSDLMRRFPGVGRDYREEFASLLRGAVRTALLREGFAEEGGLFRRTAGGLVRCIHFQPRILPDGSADFRAVEGYLSFLREDAPSAREPVPRQEDVACSFDFSSLAAGAPASPHGRYRLADRTPGQVAALLDADLEGSVLPFAAAVATPEDLRSAGAGTLSR